MQEQHRSCRAFPILHSKTSATGCDEMKIIHLSFSLVCICKFSLTFSLPVTWLHHMT